VEVVGMEEEVVLAVMSAAIATPFVRANHRMLE
jgi:hypothetical protein